VSITQITEHFAWSEAACHSGADVPLECQPVARRLAETVLEPLRAQLGGALVPISWYRTPWYNASVGGAPKSQHMTGGAADIRPADIADLPRLKQYVEEMLAAGELPALGGWGWYAGRWIHVDIRQRPADGHVAHWLGRGVGSEETT
jgi:uncharacterized protein YcbK (DUF882 family)